MTGEKREHNGMRFDIRLIPGAKCNNMTLVVKQGTRSRDIKRKIYSSAYLGKPYLDLLIHAEDTKDPDTSEMMENITDF